MNRMRRLSVFCSALALFAAPALFAPKLLAQDPQNPPNPSIPQPANPASNPADAPQSGGGQDRGPRVIGRIAAIHQNSLDITRPDGQTVTVKISSDTQFRKDRQPASLTDFKVGDGIMVRGDENPDHSINAKLIGGRTGNGPGPGGAGAGGGMGMSRGNGANGGGRPGGAMGANMGTLGKDYVAGDVTAIDAPKLSIMRPDGVAQNVELTENTTIRKGRDPVTMADIKVGDHVMVRGGMEGNAFAPKSVIVMSPEQWQRMQEMRNNAGGTSDAATPGATPAPPPAPASQSTPSGPPN